VRAHDERAGALKGERTAATIDKLLDAARLFAEREPV
jgi:hypothetical protein